MEDTECCVQGRLWGELWDDLAQLPHVMKEKTAWERAIIQTSWFWAHKTSIYDSTFSPVGPAGPGGPKGPGRPCQWTEHRHTEEEKAWNSPWLNKQSKKVPFCYSLADLQNIVYNKWYNLYILEIFLFTLKQFPGCSPQKVLISFIHLNSSLHNTVFKHKS